MCQCGFYEKILIGPTGGDGYRRPDALHDSRLALEPPDVGGNLFDICGRDPFNFRHIAELPMMRANTIGGGPLKGEIAMVIRFVDLMDKRRPLTRSGSSLAMATSTIGIKLRFALL